MSCPGQLISRSQLEEPVVLVGQLRRLAEHHHNDHEGRMVFDPRDKEHPGPKSRTLHTMLAEAVDYDLSTALTDMHPHPQTRVSLRAVASSRLRFVLIIARKSVVGQFS